MNFSRRAFAGALFKLCRNALLIGTPLPSAAIIATDSALAVEPAAGVATWELAGIVFSALAIPAMSRRNDARRHCFAAFFAAFFAGFLVAFLDGAFNNAWSIVIKR